MRQSSPRKSGRSRSSTSYNQDIPDHEDTKGKPNGSLGEDDVKEEDYEEEDEDELAEEEYYIYRALLSGSMDRS